MDDREQRINDLAYKTLILARNTLLVNLRFLDMSLSMFEYLPNSLFPLATDGKYLVYDPTSILRRYRVGKEVPVRDYLHVVLHCVYRHMFTGLEADSEIWDLACDIAVENNINELDLRCTVADRQSEHAGCS